MDNADLWGALEASFELHGNRTAIIADGDRVTYSELMAQVQAISTSLGMAELRTGDRVMIAVRRSVAQVAAVLAAVKLNCVWMAVDYEAYPAERIRRIRGLANPTALIVDGFGQRLLGVHGGSPCPSVGVSIKFEDSAQNVGPLPSSASYVVFTSGTSGVPKAVVQTYDAISVMLAAADEAFGKYSGRVTHGGTSPSFDVAVLEWAWTLSNGGTLRLFPNAYEAASHPADDSVVLVTVPSVLAQALRIPSTEWGPGHIFLGGEVVGEGLLRSIWRQSPQTTVHNAYGPSEAFIVTWETVHSNSWVGGSVPLGRPVAGVQVQLVTEESLPSPSENEGEAFIGGRGLALGYWRSSELVQSNFDRNPLILDGQRYYRSGDLMRRGANDLLTYLGRLDDQVKIAGLRVELQEVIAIIERFNGVERAEAVVARDQPGTERDFLVAFVEESLGEHVDLAELRRFLLQHLAAGAVPSRLVILDAGMPLTPNGKIDRAALVVPPGTSRPYVEPNSPVERRLVATFERILGMNPIGMADSLQDLGGDSLSATALATEIGHEFGAEMPVQDLLAGLCLSDLIRQCPQLIDRDRNGSDQ